MHAVLLYESGVQVWYTIHGHVFVMKRRQSDNGFAHTFSLHYIRVYIS